MSDDQPSRQHHALPGLPVLKALAKLLAHQAAHEAAGPTHMGLPAASLAMFSTASMMTATTPLAAIAVST